MSENIKPSKTGNYDKDPIFNSAGILSASQSSGSLSDKIFDSLYNNFKLYLIESASKHDLNTESYFSKSLTEDEANKLMDEDQLVTRSISCNPNGDMEKRHLESQVNFIEAYIKTISNYIENSQESTLQGLNIAIKRSTDKLFLKIKEENLLPKERSILSLKACSEILINIINKHISKKLNIDFETIKKSLVTITQDLCLLSVYAKDKISHFFNWSIKNGMTFLVHGYSTTILHSLIHARKSGIIFKVLITESRPDNTAELMAKSLKEYGIESKIILDISIGYFIMDIDAILVGADAVCENGGIINKIGTFTIACVAKSFKKPFYVMVESLKFLKMYPLNQSDVPFPSDEFKKENGLNYNYSVCDFTAPEFITLLFTDIGIFTPSAVSDELIQMFYN